MDNIIFKCPYCEKPLKVDASAVGRKVDCPECGQEIEIPIEPPSELDVADAVEEQPPQQQETRPSDTTQEESNPQDSEPSQLVDSEPMTPAKFRDLLEETSKSIIPELEQASAEIRKALG